MPDDVNFVVLFHAFTGLQCRAWRYLYLVAVHVHPRDRHRSLAGRFSSVRHQILWITLLITRTFKHYLRRGSDRGFTIYRHGIIPNPDTAKMAPE